MYPFISLFIPAYNEEKVIESKIRNSLSLDYPKDRLEIVVAADGCTDETVGIARSFVNEGLIVFESVSREGKNGVINRFVPMCKGEIIVFTDANAFLSKDALKLLVRNFADGTIGYVVGNLRYTKDKSYVGTGEGIYFRYESILKQLESRIGVVVVGNGAIYAIRRFLFAPVDGDVPNDLFHPLYIASRGYEGVYESEAVAVEKPTTSAREEYGRRVRIVSRSFNGFVRYHRKYNMLRGAYGFCFISHKLLRWFAPVAILGLLVMNLMLDSIFFRFTLYGQISFYLLAAAAGVSKGRGSAILSIPFYFCLINLAGFVGVMKSLCGRQYAMWDVAGTTR